MKWTMGQEAGHYRLGTGASGAFFMTTRCNTVRRNPMPSAETALALSRIVHVTITEDTLSVDLEDGRTVSVPIGWYPRLVQGTPAECAHFQISGAGYGIHWPDLDEDIGVDGFLLSKKSRESPSSLERWIQNRRK